MDRSGAMPRSAWVEIRADADKLACLHRASAVGTRGRLFSSATIRSGTTPVNGTQSLAPGTYPFICTIHDPQMAAQLVVRPGAAPPRLPPPPRPDIAARSASWA
jgi:hypothetical protein